MTVEHTKVFWTIGYVSSEYLSKERFYTRSQADAYLLEHRNEYPSGYEVVEVSMKWRTSDVRI